MKTTKEITREVLIRSGTVRKNNELKRIRALSGSSSAVFGTIMTILAMKYKKLKNSS